LYPPYSKAQKLPKNRKKPQKQSKEEKICMKTRKIWTPVAIAAIPGIIGGFIVCTNSDSPANN